MTDFKSAMINRYSTLSELLEDLLSRLYEYNNTPISVVV